MQKAYQDYVDELKYQPYKWPPNISLAQLHSRVSEQGPEDPHGVKCPCCNYKSKKMFKKWIWRDISQDCEGFGSAIPAFFGLLKYYTAAIFIVLLINSIYPLWAVYYTCDKLIPNLAQHEGSCLHIGFLYYLNFSTQLDILIENNHEQMGDTITFYFLMFVNLSSLFYLYSLDKKEAVMYSQTRVQISKNSLIVSNLEQLDPVKFKQKLNIETHLQIVQIMPLKQIKKYYELYNKRNTLYYKLMGKLVVGENPRSQIKQNKSLYILQKQFIKTKQSFKSSKHSNLIVFFKSSYMCDKVYQHYRLSQINKILLGTRKLLLEIGLTKQQLDLPINIARVPDVRQIRWQNAGQNLSLKLSGRIKSFIIAVGIVIICLFIFQEPIKWSLATHTDKSLNIYQKLFPIIISFLLFAMSVFYRNYMTEVSKRRFPLNQFEASKFVLMSSMLFHIVFYIVIPVIFFIIPDQTVSKTIKLFVISEQARTFIFMQLILNIIDIPYSMWKRRKVKSLSDQREGFKYNQKMLHKIVQYRDFPLQSRIQTMFKIWSFALFYAFYLPYMMIYMFIALNILYVLQKRNFYLHYSLRRVIPLQLQKTFLLYFVNFFCLFQCFSYVFQARKTWMIIAGISSTVGFLLINLIYWILIQPKSKQQNKLKKQKQSLMAGENKQQDQLAIKNVLQQAQKYKKSYTQFIQSISSDKLDNQISQYLSQLGSELSDEDNKNKISRMIQMAQSQFQIEND